MKALVTGAAGFLGQHVVARLRAGAIAVRAFVRRETAAVPEAEEIYRGDLCCREDLAEAVRGVDCVVHAGARVRTAGAWAEFEAANVRATEDLIRLAGEAGVKRFVHVSSLSVYCVRTEGAVVTEDGPFESAAESRGFYARSKLMADESAQRAIERGMPLTIVRPGLLFGPGRRPPLARRAFALRGLRLIMARPGYELPLAYVENVADAIYLAATAPRAKGRAYTIVDAHVRQDEYARLYREIGAESWRPLFVPPRLVLPLAALAERAARVARVRPWITRYQVARTVLSARFPTDRARAELDWTPRIPLSEALRRSFRNEPGTPAHTLSAA